MLPRRLRRDRVWRRWTVAWLGGSVLGIANGAVRDLLYRNRVGDLVAHQLSTATLLALLTWYLWVLERRWPIPSTEGALAIGGTWLVLTVLFEFGFGHYVTHDSWSQLLGNYHLAHGRGVPPLSRTPPMGGCPYGREGETTTTAVHGGVQA